MNNYLLVDIFHKNRISSHSQTVLLLPSSLNIFQALANSTADKQNINFKIVLSSMQPCFQACILLYDSGLICIEKLSTKKKKLCY